MPVPGKAGWLGQFLSSAPSVWNCPGCPLVSIEIDIYFSLLAGVCLGTFWSGLSFPTVWSHLGSFLSLSWGPGPPTAGRVLMAGKALVASGVSMAGGAAHPLHSLLQNGSHHQGSLPDIPAKGHHLLIGLEIHGSESCIRIRPGGIGWQMHLFPLLLCRQPLRPEAPLYWA